MKLFKSFILRQQFLSAVFLVLMCYVLGFFLSDLLIYAGPSAFNRYTNFVKLFTPLLFITHTGMASLFLFYLYGAFLINMENFSARPREYRLKTSGSYRPALRRLIPYMALCLFIFWGVHAFYFRGMDPAAATGFLADGKKDGIYGVMYRAFSNPPYAVGYILAMSVLGILFSFSLQDFMQAFGFNADGFWLFKDDYCQMAGVFLSLALASIPFFILLDSLKYY
ncbi:MAG: hypothetical protein WC552_00705 [Candidatus Omnitrophota bacterium]